MISVIIPAYNEEVMISKAVQVIDEVLEEADICG